MNVDLYQYKIGVNLFGAAYGPQNKDRAMSFYYGPRGEKNCLLSFQQTETQTSFLCYRDSLENSKFKFRKFRYDTFQNDHNKSADQSA